MRARRWFARIFVVLLTLLCVLPGSLCAFAATEVVKDIDGSDRVIMESTDLSSGTLLIRNKNTWNWDETKDEFFEFTLSYHLDGAYSLDSYEINTSRLLIYGTYKPGLTLTATGDALGIDASRLSSHVKGYGCTGYATHYRISMVYTDIVAAPNVYANSGRLEGNAAVVPLLSCSTTPTEQSGEIKIKFYLEASMENEYGGNTKGNNFNVIFTLNPAPEEATRPGGESDFSTPESSDSLYDSQDAFFGNVEQHVRIDTNAAETAGEQSASVPATVAAGVGLAATAAAVAAAGAVAGSAGAAGGGSGNGGETGEEKKRSGYKMVLYKDFGNKIRYSLNPVFVYARMVELPPGGGERDRPDLTARISISAGSPGIQVQQPLMRGQHMAASVYAHSKLHESARPSEGIIAFAFTGEGGSFRNNVRFQLVGAPRIEVQNAWLLEGAGNTAQLPFALRDFIAHHKAQVEFAMKDADLPFSIELERPDMNNGLLRISTNGNVAEMEGLFRHYHGTISAKGPNDEVEEAFVITLCREGLYLDFGTRNNRPEIKCYPDENGEMPANRVGVGLALWDEGAKRLKMLPPPELEIRVEDEKRIGERIGLLWNPAGETMRGRQITGESLAVWELRAKKLLPYLEQVPATLHTRCTHDGREFEGAFTVRLTSDLVAYYKEYDRQWEHLWNLLSCAFSPQADQLRHQLSRMRLRMGLSDFQDYERAFRQKLQAELEHAQAEHMADCVFYDELIGALEWMELLGSICTEILLAVFTGPMAAFALSNFKDLLVDVGKEYLSNPKFGASDVPEMLWGTLVKGTSGAADNLVDFPQPNEYKKLAIWISVYFCYRVIWHWQFDMDEETGKPAGLRSAIKAAALDLTLKAALELGLKEFLQQPGQSDRVFGRDMRGVKDLAELDGNAFNSARDSLYEKIGEFADRMIEFARKIQGGLQV